MLEKENAERYNNYRHQLDLQFFGNKTDHAKQRTVERKIDDRSIEYAKKNALKISEIYYDSSGRPTQDYIGEKITIVVNPDTDSIITAYRTTPSARKKYKNQK